MVRDLVLHPVSKPKMCVSSHQIDVHVNMDNYPLALFYQAQRQVVFRLGNEQVPPHAGQAKDVAKPYHLCN